MDGTDFSAREVYARDVRTEYLKKEVDHLNHLPLLELSSALRDPITDSLAGIMYIQQRLDEDERMLCEGMLMNNYKMLRVVQNIEVVARLNGEVEREIFDLVKMLQGLSLASNCICSHNGISVRTALPRRTVLVEASQPLLMNALLNVLRNSYQFTRDGNCIEISLRVTGGRALLRIADRGMGIMPEFLNEVVTPYFSISPYGQADPKPGLGLGLASAQCVLHHFGGSFAVESRHGEGTAILMSLPVLEAGEGGGEVTEVDTSDMLLNRFSPLYIQYSGYCRFQA